MATSPAIDPTVRVDFAAEGPMTFRVRELSRSRLRVIEVDYRDHGPGANADFPLLPDTYLVGVRYLAEKSRASVAGKDFNYGSPAGYTHILYLSAVDTVELNTHSHTIEVLLPRPFIDELADDLGAPRVGVLGNGSCVLRPDPVIPRLTDHIRPFLDDPLRLDVLHADSFMWAFGTYVLHRYGNLVSQRPRIGSLSTWQERIAKEWIDVTVQSGTTLTELASLCGLSVSHFANAFRKSTGLSPHRWQTKRRVERATALLRMSSPLAWVALECGFADQSHLTRVFKKATGMAPRTWQLANQIRVSSAGAPGH